MLTRLSGATCASATWSWVQTLYKLLAHKLTKQTWPLHLNTYAQFALAYAISWLLNI